jgi:hypothetical protein
MATKEATVTKVAEGASGADGAPASKGPAGESPDVASSVLEESMIPKRARAPRVLVPEVDAVSTEATMHAPRPEDGEELRTATQLPTPSLTFAEMHRALGDLHVVSAAFVEYGLLPVPESRLGPKGRVESLSFLEVNRLTISCLVAFEGPGEALDRTRGRSGEEEPFPHRHWK